MGDPSLSALSVILTEDLKLAMSCIYQAKITTKRREDPEVRKVNQWSQWSHGAMSCLSHCHTSNFCRTWIDGSLYC